MKIEESTIVETNDFKVIIYPASRALTAKEVKEITEKLYDFLPTWNAHGKGLTSSFKIESMIGIYQAIWAAYSRASTREILKK